MGLLLNELYEFKLGPKLGFDPWIDPFLSDEPRSPISSQVATVSSLSLDNPGFMLVLNKNKHKQL